MGYACSYVNHSDVTVDTNPTLQDEKKNAEKEKKMHF